MSTFNECELSLQEQKIAQVNKIYVVYPRHQSILERIEKCHRYSSFSAEPECMFIKGRTSAGKTTISKAHLKRHPSSISKEKRVVPVLSAIIPAPATVKGVVTDMLDALGDPLAERGTIASQTLRLRRYLDDCAVEMIILDEFQHFIDRDSLVVLKTVADWLKNLINATKRPIILIGLPEAEEVLNANEQLSRRFAHRVELLPFQFGNEEQILEFYKFLQYLERMLPLQEASNLASSNLAPRIFYASDGYVGYVMKLIRKAAIAAIERGLEKLDLDLLSEAYEEYLKADKPGKTNPFMDEVFYLSDHFDQQNKSDQGTRATNRRIKGKSKKTKASDVLS